MMGPTYMTGVLQAASPEVAKKLREMLEAAASVDLDLGSNLGVSKTHQSVPQVDADGQVVMGKRGRPVWERDGLASAWADTKKHLRSCDQIAAIFDAAERDTSKIRDAKKREQAEALRAYARTISREMSRRFRERMRDGRVFAHDLGSGRVLMAYPAGMSEQAREHARSVEPVSAEQVRLIVDRAMSDIMA